MTLLGGLMILCVVLAVGLSYVWFDLYGHKREHYIRETYPEREKLAQDAVALGERWHALKASDEIRIGSGDVFGFDEYVSRLTAKERLKALKARKYEQAMAAYQQLKAEYELSRAQSNDLREKAKETTSSSVSITKYIPLHSSSNILYIPNSNRSGKKSKSKGKRRKKK